MAIAFHASVRIQLKNLGEIVKKNEVVGVNIEATIIKNKVSIPLRKVKFPIMFSSGVDNTSSLYNFFKDKGIIVFDKGGYHYVDVDEQTGEVIEDIKIDKSFVEFLESNPDIKEKLKKRMLDSLVISYENEK